MLIDPKLRLVQYLNSGAINNHGPTYSEKLDA